MTTDRYYARSASDRTEEWPIWFVADRHQAGLNVTARLFEKLTGLPSNGAVLALRENAEAIAAKANYEAVQI